MLNQSKKMKFVVVILIFNLLVQMILPIFSSETIAAEESSETTETTEESQEITRNYEIKSEETWDISANNDGSVIAKWTRNNRTVTISGNGEMKNWEYNSTEDWHNTQYINVIKNVIIEEELTSIGYCAFKGCSSLENITIPESVTSIRDYAFQGCSSLENITIPEGVTSIEKRVFLGCSSLENITIPEGVTSIGYETFYKCSSLKNITIPESVTNIGYDAFKKCSSLEKIIVNENNKNYMDEDGILFSKDRKTIIKYPAKKIDVIEYSIPEEVTSIGSSAFEGCSSLKSITIPEGVTSIGGSAFEGCSSLESIAIPEGVTSIGYGAFSGCSSLESITIPEGETSIGDGAFSGCSSLENITIPENITSIGIQAFMNCSNLGSITIPEGVTSIGYGAFSGCSSLKNITIPENVTTIENYAIAKTTIIYVKADSEGHRYAEENQQGYILEGEANIYTTNYEIKEEETWDISANNDGSVIAKWVRNNRTLVISGNGEIKDWEKNSTEDWHKTQYTNVVQNIIIEEGATSIGNYAFYGCSSLENITILEGVRSIGEYAFEGCSSLESITIPEGVTSIEWRLFYGCSSLESITIPEGVKGIGYDAFYGCSSLESITIPEGVEAIGHAAFSGCSSLESIIIPQSVTSIENSVFSGCSSLQKIIVNENNKNYMDENGILYNKSKNKLIRYPEGKKDVNEYNIPESVTSIGEYAFEDCSSLENITIPESVTRIEYGVFRGCSSLENITIPEGVTSIEKRVFEGCSSLESITIPKSVTSIGYGAFYGCSSLNNMIIPEGVTSIENSAIDKGTIIYCKSNTEAHKYAEGAEQGYMIDDKAPIVVFTPNNIETPQKRFEIKVTVTDEEEWIGVNEDSLRYQWSQDETAPEKDSFTQRFTNGEKISKEGGDGKWYLYVYAEDNLGNEAIIRSEAYIFDNSAPTCTVSYSTLEETSKNVTVTITTNEQVQQLEGWTQSQDKLKLTKEYSENTEEVLTIKDLAGNESQVNIKISNIIEAEKNVKGDINQDGQINTVDMIKMLRHIAASKSQGTEEKNPTWKLTGEAFTIADINEDGQVNTIDLMKLLRHISASKDSEIAEKHPDWII